MKFYEISLIDTADYMYVVMLRNSTIHTYKLHHTNFRIVYEVKTTCSPSNFLITHVKQICKNIHIRSCIFKCENKILVSSNEYIKKKTTNKQQKLINLRIY